MIKYSIIIPIYNTEKYLEECLVSIKKQKIDNIEIILVDDGSTDSSSNICKRITKEDSRFKYYYKKNGGVSSARNLGIRKSTGQYIIFVDSDDYISNNYFEVVEDNIGNIDMLCFNYYDLYTNKSIKHIIKTIDEASIKEKILISNELGGFLFNKVFNASIIKNNNLKFNENIHFCEDLIFLSNYLDYCSKYSYCNEPLYYYRIRKSSVTKNFISVKNVSILEAYQTLINKYDDIKYKRYYSYLFYYYYYLLRKFFPINTINCDNIKKQLKIKLILLEFFPKIYLKCRNHKTTKNYFE